jgi:NAD(P)-dependent dehydrogenase (short-subunit alcohol dehydrogenase family)
MPALSKLFDLTGKTTLITGAGSGFGRSIAIALAEYGSNIAAADLHTNKAEETADSVRTRGYRAFAIEMDVSKPDSILQMVHRTEREFGRIDILVNCAGISQHDPAELTPLETWDRVLDVNLRGTFLTCQAVARVMLKNSGGVILNFSSIAGVVGMGRGANAYCASKGGVNALTKQLALEWASRGIRVNAIAPCQFLTPGLEEVLQDPQFDSKALMHRAAG